MPVPHEVLCLFWYFIEHNGTVTCEVTGRRRHSIGLEVPYAYMFNLAVLSSAQTSGTNFDHCSNTTGLLAAPLLRHNFALC